MKVHECGYEVHECGYEGSRVVVKVHECGYGSRVWL